jgi:hypothetical protein
LESTITEQDVDSTTKQVLQGFRQEPGEFEPDLRVDGLSDSIVSRLIRILSFRRPA